MLTEHPSLGLLLAELPWSRTNGKVEVPERRWRPFGPAARARWMYPDAARESCGHSQEAAG